MKGNAFFKKRWPYSLFKTIGIIGLLIFPIIGQSQVTDILETYVKTGLESNLNLKQKTLNITKSLEALREANSLFKPQITFNASYSVAAGGRSIDFPIGDLLNPVYSTLNTLTQTNQFPTVANERITFLPHDFQETKVRVIQPLYNTDIYYNKKAKAALITVEQAKKATYEQELTKDIKMAYYKYLQTLEASKIYKETKVLLQEILRTNEKLVKNHKATRDVIFNAKYEIQNIDNEIIKAKKNEILAKAYFNFLLNRDLKAPILVAENVKIKPNLDEKIQAVDVTEKRKEFEQIKGVMAANEQAMKLKIAQRLPQVVFVGDVGFQGTGYNFFNDQAFVFGSLNLTWSIYDGQQRKIQIEQIKLDQSLLSTQYQQLKQQIELQVESAYQELKATEQAIKTSKAALVNAKEGFRLIQKQYKNGKTFFYQLIQAKTNLTNAKIALSIRKFDFLIKQVELDYARGL